MIHQRIGTFKPKQSATDDDAPTALFWGKGNHVVHVLLGAKRQHTFGIGIGQWQNKRRWPCHKDQFGIA